MPLHLPEGVLPTGDPVIERLPELEVTIAEPIGDIGVESLPELDPTIAEATPEVGAAPVPDLERTALELDDLPGFDEEIPDLERAVEEFERLPPMEEGIPDQCPSCGFVKASGRMCNNCGRSKIRILPPSDFASFLLVPLDGDDAESRVRCRGCGAMMKPGALCSDCGQPLPPQEM